MRESPYVNPRGFLIKNTVDLAASAFGSDIEYIRGTMARRLLPAIFAEGDHPWRDGRSGRDSIAALVPTVLAGIRRARRHYSFAHGEWPGEATAIPIDERFFNGGAIPCGASANANSARTIITGIPSAENSSPCLTSNTPSQFWANYRAPFH